jgi:hypothetical protein
MGINILWFLGGFVVGCVVTYFVVHAAEEAWRKERAEAKARLRKSRVDDAWEKINKG